MNLHQLVQSTSSVVTGLSAGVLMGASVDAAEDRGHGFGSAKEALPLLAGLAFGGALAAAALTRYLKGAEPVQQPLLPESRVEPAQRDNNPFDAQAFDTLEVASLASEQVLTRSNASAPQSSIRRSVSEGNISGITPFARQQAKVKASRAALFASNHAKADGVRAETALNKRIIANNNAAHIAHGKEVIAKVRGSALVY